MPNRMVRENLLTSWRYERLSSDAKLFYFHILLCADDLGCIDLGPTFIRRRVLFSQDSDERIAKLIGELADVDLIRPYRVNDTCFGFVPRFRQRVQIKYAKYPLPPEPLYADDEDAGIKFQKIKEQTSKTSVGQQLDILCTPDVQRTVSGKRKAVIQHPTSADTDRTDNPSSTEVMFEELWMAYPKRNGGNPKKRALRAYNARLREGVKHAELLEGVRRYAAWCRQGGKEGSEFVKMTATFLGPDEHYRQPWSVEPSIPGER